MRYTNLKILLSIVFFFAALGFSTPADGTLPDEQKDCLQGSGNPAVVACKHALEKAPNDLKLHLKLGDLLLKLERYGEAAVVFQKAGVLYPENQKVKYKFEIAKSLQDEREWLEKRKDDMADKIAGPNETARIELNRIRCTRFKGSKALAACDKALKTKPNDPVLHYSRGKSLLEMGRIEKAKEAFTMALRFDPDNREYLLKLAALGSLSPEGVAIGSQEQGADGTADLKTASGSTQAHVLKRMALLKSLLDQELISKDEFNRLKKSILATAFPSGREQKDRTEAKPTAGINFGNYHALVIGVQNYRHLTKLQTVRRDVVAVADVLKTHYGFKVKSLFDATRRQILLALGEYRSKLMREDNLLIYYAGHGWLDKEADTGYWLPVDAAQDNDVDWLSLGTVTSAILAIAAKHVIVVADSCYSGKLTRGIHVVQRKSSNYLERLARKRTRVVLSSGGLEPVLDSGGAGGHSVFAAALLKALSENHGIMDGTTLFTQIRRLVMLNATQTPEYADIRKAGHEGGDFIFVRR